MVLLPRGLCLLTKEWKPAIGGTNQSEDRDRPNLSAMEVICRLGGPAGIGLAGNGR